MTQTAATAVGARPDSLLAGLDLRTVGERDADDLAHAVAAALSSQGATTLTVATHWARAGDLRHVALSVESAGVGVDIVRQTLSDVARVRSGDVGAVLLGDRYTGPAELRDPAAAALGAHAARTGGRVVVFPGGADLTETVPVARVLACSAIDRVRVLTGGDADPDTMLITRDFLRPRWEHGHLVLHTQPAAGGTLVPFETPTPTPCCADHG